MTYLVQREKTVKENLQNKNLLERALIVVWLTIKAKDCLCGPELSKDGPKGPIVIRRDKAHLGLTQA